MTEQQARQQLDRQWERKTLNIDWIALESFQREVITSAFIVDPWKKLVFLAEAIGAWTGRGVPRVQE